MRVAISGIGVCRLFEIEVAGSAVRGLARAPGDAAARVASRRVIKPSPEQLAVFRRGYRVLRGGTAISESHSALSRMATQERSMVRSEHN
jgi:hypothetical protein